MAFSERVAQHLTLQQATLWKVAWGPTDRVPKLVNHGIGASFVTNERERSPSRHTFLASPSTS